MVGSYWSAFKAKQLTAESEFLPNILYGQYQSTFTDSSARPSTFASIWALPLCRKSIASVFFVYHQSAGTVQAERENRLRGKHRVHSEVLFVWFNFCIFWNKVWIPEWIKGHHLPVCWCIYLALLQHLYRPLTVNEEQKSWTTENSDSIYSWPDRLKCEYIVTAQCPVIWTAL